MFVRNFYPDRFLRTICGTDPFRDYCRERGIAFDVASTAAMQAEDYQRWLTALAGLPNDHQVQIDLEFARINEMADRDAVAHCLKAAEGQELPSDQIPGEAAVALWFFLHHPKIFHEVFLHQEAAEREGWHNAQAPSGLGLNYLEAKAAALAASLKDFFQAREGIGRFCAVDAYHLSEAYCFVAHISDRVQVVEAFTSRGELNVQRLWPAVPVLFAYYPQDGTVLLKSHLHSSDWILELFQRFARAVLGVELGQEHCLGHVFELDLLKRRFDPLPDADDMQMVRVKTLHLLYPERQGRRQVRFETLLSDEQFAVPHLVQAHLTGVGLFDQLQVAHAELQIKLHVDGESKSYIVRLWPNRCNLSQTPLAERFRACLQRWGISHVR
jgi:hypothetical protein